MKKITLFKQLAVALAFCLFAFNSFATSITIVASSFIFTPSAITITFGDTVCFQGIGTFHPLIFDNDSNTQYVINNTCFVAGSSVLPIGTNKYYCANHVITSGMTGVIVVDSSSTGISRLDINKVSSVAYPNPFKDKTVLNLPVNTEKVYVYNLMGKAVRSYKVAANETTIELDLSNLPAGIYFYSLISESGIIETKKLVKMKL